MHVLVLPTCQGMAAAADTVKVAVVFPTSMAVGAGSFHHALPNAAAASLHTHLSPRRHLYST